MQNNAAPDGEQRSHEYGQATGMIHRRVNLNPVTLPQLPRDNRVVSVPCNLPVWNHDALRPSGGAAGIEQAENILGLESRGKRTWTNPIDSFGIAQCLRDTVLRIQTDGVLEDHELLELLREFLVPCRVHEAARSAVRDCLVQLASRAACAERDENDPRLTRCPKGIDIFNPVLGKNADTITRDE